MSRSIRKAEVVPLLMHDKKHFPHKHSRRSKAGSRAIPLCMAGSCKEVRVLKVRAGSGLQKKLADMGLTPGTEIKLINCQGAGPVLVDLKGSRLALGRGMAMKIMVEEV
jgi:ferrous iron transport protein A